MLALPFQRAEIYEFKENNTSQFSFTFFFQRKSFDILLVANFNDKSYKKKITISIIMKILESKFIICISSKVLIKNLRI